MKYPEDTSQAASYLKSAVPLMVNNDIAPNPINYTLWYNYVAENIPVLSQALEKALADFGTCPPELSQELYLRYIIGEHIDCQQQTLQGLTKLTARLLTQFNDSSSDCAALEKSIQQNIANIQAASSQQELDRAIELLLEQSNAIASANTQFRHQLDSARKEISELQKTLEETQQHAYHDQLTKLYNRHALNKHLKQLLSEPKRAKQTCLIMMDVDHFKSFNDQYGHLMGDQILEHVGAILRNHSPSKTFNARFGGEEFAIVVTPCSLSGGASLAEELRQRIDSLQLKIKHSREVLCTITASFGVTQFSAGDTIESLINRADRALYKAKERGRNRVEVALS